jgi:hypothetical protein
MSHFPALDVREKATPPKPSRVLVIKGPKPANRVVGAKGSKDKTNNVWDKVASAASVANAPRSKPTSLQNSPQSSRPSSPSNTFRTPSKTPWSGASSSSTQSKNTAKGNEFPSLKPKAFPSLPAAAPKHQMILNMRKTTSGPKLANAWGAGNSEDGEDSAAEDSSSSSSSNTKKKGRKNKVLFRVGL